jgi:hypothetical protein
MDWLTSVDMFLAQSVIGTDATLSALGAGWGAIETELLPIRHPRLGIGLILTLGSDAPTGRHALDVRLENGYGIQVELGTPPDGPRPPGFGRIPADLFIEPVPDGIDAQVRRVCFAFNIDGLVLREWGLHNVVVSLDRTDIKSHPFVVRRPHS